MLDVTSSNSDLREQRGAYLRRLVGTWVPHEPTIKQELALREVSTKEILFGGAAGGGKALGLDVMLPTPLGWVANGDVKAGQELFDERGRVCRVIKAHEILFNQPTYRLYLDNGSSLVACAEHRWFVYDKNSRESGRGGSLKTTREIFETQHHLGRTNYSIRKALALELPWQVLELDPYVLGAWLGDGNSYGIGFYTVDEEILSELRQAGFEIRRWPSTPFAYGIQGLLPKLRELSLLGNKHIPEHYLRAERSQRLALLQGLMDTDGTANGNGSVEFSVCSKRLAEQTLELVRSLGHKANLREGPAKLEGRTVGTRYRIKWTPHELVFRLSRKRSKQKTDQRGTQCWHYITRVEEIPSQPVRCLTVDSPTQQYLCGDALIPTHNTDWLLMEALRFVHIPGFSALMLRRTYPQLAQAGGLIPRSLEWLSKTDAQYSKGESRWTFPSGATIKFGHMQHEEDKYNYAGSEYQLICWDELTQFTPTQYTFLFSRLRGPEYGELAKVPARYRSASNPGGPGHDWVKSRLVDNVENAPDRLFIPSRFEDNPYIDQLGYRASLENLTPRERDQLLLGDWDTRPEGGRFKREWFTLTNQIGNIPRTKIRAWDLAATEPKTGQDPDYSVGVLMSIDGDKRVYIEDVQRFRVSARELDRKLLKIAEIDGPTTTIYIEEEPGSAGKIASEHFRTVLLGYPVYFHKPSGKKEVRAAPFASYAEGGRVIVLEAPWNAEFFRELEMFTGRDDVHDDQVDAASLAFAQCKVRQRGPLTWGSPRSSLYS